MNRRELIKIGALAGLSGMARPGWAQPAPVAAEPAETLYLNFNENALGVPAAAREAALEAISSGHRYPDAARDRLTEALASQHGVSPESLVLGAGSTQLLQMAVQAAAAPGATLVMAEPTFGAISWYARPLGYRVERVPLDDRFAHDLAAMRARAEASSGPVVVYLCNPNNPTATLTPSAEIERWVREAPDSTLFVLDEAYHEYVHSPGYRSPLPRVGELPRLVVTRTFSKIYGMAGMRLGYAVAHPDTASRLRAFASMDNTNAPALAAGLAALADPELLARRRRSNTAARKVVEKVLAELELETLPSHANFLMHRVPGDLESYIERMRQHDILVGRRFPGMPDYSRLSLGRPEQMQRFASTLRQFRQRGWV